MSLVAAQLIMAALCSQSASLLLRWGVPHRGWVDQGEGGLVWEARGELRGRDIRSQAPHCQASPQSPLLQARRQEGEPPRRDQVWAPALVRQHMCPRTRQSSTGRCLGNLGNIGR